MPIALGLTVAALAIVFTLTGNVVGVIFLTPVALIAWFVFIGRPTASATAPRRDLRADRP